MGKQESDQRKTQKYNLRKQRQIESLGRLGGGQSGDSCEQAGKTNIQSILDLVIRLREGCPKDYTLDRPLMYLDILK